MSEEIACGFNSLTIEDHSSSDVPRELISSVSGYVVRGGITAILGASASGKSVLMQALSGRLNQLTIKGEVYMDGSSVDPKDHHNPVAYVPQGDSLIGDLTAREVTQITAYLKRNEPKNKLDTEVQTLLERLGIDRVADGIIGTIIFRGLSGGQKKRAEASCELIAAPSILFLDEPTSGLDSKVSYDVLTTIKTFVKSSDKKHSVILSIHQPNTKILNLFDHIMLLDRGKMTFFGTLSEAETYFSRIGCPCPAAVTPTDYYLQITDKGFNSTFDFFSSFASSEEKQASLARLQATKKESNDESLTALRKERAQFNTNTVPLWYQVYILVYREFTLAARDPTLYYFQVIMLMGFAFMSGAVFWQLPRNVDNFNLVPGGLLWICFCYVWVHAFKVYYLSSGNKRAKHEIMNHKYSTLAVLISDTISTAALGTMFFVIGPIGYFMMGLPAEAYPFMILITWVTFLAAEGMIAILTKLSDNAVTSMVFAELSLVCLEVFGGGAFIPWNQTPDYWVWLQEINVFYRSSLAIEMHVLDFMEFTCTLRSGPNGPQCIGPNGVVAECNAVPAAGATTCKVDGRELLSTTQGINPASSQYEAFAYLILLFVCLKLGVALFTYYPPPTIFYYMNVFLREKVLPMLGMKDGTAAYMKVVSGGSAASEGDASGDVEMVKGALPTPLSANVNVVIPTLDQTNTFRDSETTSLSWTNFSVLLAKNGKPLVDNVSGYVQSGRILALMGPSGAGKTTLLNGLADRAPYAHLKGEVQFSGRTLTHADLTYVPQFDEVNDVMTIAEHMQLVGSLTCADHAEMMTRCEELLKVLGLSDKRDVKVRNLSGGEIKRLSIGVGLISNPFVLFLDEPTTGLDSTAAYSIVSYLSTVTKATNVAVIMTIHQPSALVFNMLDDLFLMADGRIVYSGSIKDAAPYFGSHGFSNPAMLNPADYYLDLVQEAAPGGESSTWSSLYVNSPAGSAYIKKLATAKALKSNLQALEIPSLSVRFIIMFKHFLRYLLAEPGYVVHRLYALILIALFEGSLFFNLDRTTDNFQATTGAMFSVAVAVMLCAVASTALFARDRREAVDRVENGFYDPGLYVVTQFLASSIYNLLIIIPFTLIFHFMVGLNPTAEAFFYDMLINWGHLLLMEAVIMVFIEVMKNDFLCTTAGMIFIGSNMLFSGFFRPQESVPMSIVWMNYIVPLRYSMEGFLWSNFADQEYQVSGTAYEISGKAILDNAFGLKDVHAWAMFAVLLAYVVAFRGTQYFMFAVQTGRIVLPNPFAAKVVIGIE